MIIIIFKVKIFELCFRLIRLENQIKKHFQVLVNFLRFLSSQTWIHLDFFWILSN